MNKTLIMAAALLAGGAGLSLSPVAGAAAGPAATAKPAWRSAADILAKAPDSDWRATDPQRTLYMDMDGGRVIIELAPQFAPAHVKDVLARTRAGYYNGIPIIRAQDNYVVQWGDPDGKQPTGDVPKTLKAEFARGDAGKLDFTPLPDPDTYAPEVGFADGFPVAMDPKTNQAWLTHCYGMVGAGRDVDPDSGGGAELYVVIGNAPRQLDRNVTLFGRVLQGMELLSTLPRGTGDLGFYVDPKQYVPIRSIRVEADIPVAERTPLQVMRTDTADFRALIEAKRFRREDWFANPAGHLSVCNMPVPVRKSPGT